MFIFINYIFTYTLVPNDNYTFLKIIENSFEKIYT